MLKMNEMEWDWTPRLGRYRFLFTVLAIIVPFSALAQDACVPTIRSAGPFQIDVSPPGHFIDVCAEDATLCKTLTSGYPPTVSTLAYFVLPDEWNAAKEKPRGFTRYLIAQLSGSMSPEKLPGFKQYLHSQQGQIPDHTALPSVLAARGRVPLGIVSETSRFRFVRNCDEVGVNPSVVTRICPRIHQFGDHRARPGPVPVCVR